MTDDAARPVARIVVRSLRRVEDDDPRLGQPSRVTAAPVDPQLPLLPTHEMTWPDFERLLLRVAREVQGLRAVQLFGNSGQAQEGLDAVGVNAAGDVEGVQGKKYVTFTVADLDKAVLKYLDGSLPFEIRRLAIGVSCDAHEKTVVQRMMRLNLDHKPMEFELWDRSRLSEMLRGRPEIVLEFFGPATAASFCGPYEIAPVQVPGPDAQSTANAVMLGPEASGEAKAELAVADRLRADDPAAALHHVQRAQAALSAAGFPAHAEVLDSQVTELLSRLGRRNDAARLLLDRVWAALDRDRVIDARSAEHELGNLAKSAGADDERAATDSVTAAAETAHEAIRLYTHPLGGAPDVTRLLRHGPDPTDRARLVLLAAEIALVDAQDLLVAEHGEVLRQLVDDVSAEDQNLAARLTMLGAEATGDWTGLLRQARTRTVPRSLVALIFARHARYLAVHGEFQTADESWIEAIEQACLDRRHEDAAAWLYSRRQLHVRYRGFIQDSFHPLAVALTSRPGMPRVVVGGGRTRERALAAMQAGKPREAALLLRRHLRDSVVSGSWTSETYARILLADLYQTVGEPERAAQQLVTAGEAKRSVELGHNAGNLFLDVRSHLVDPTYWTAASAFRLLAAEADLIPDDHVAGIAEQALGVLERARTGVLVDQPHFTSSVYLAAHEVLGAVAGRLDEDRASRLLAYLDSLAPVEQGHYRFTDDSHAASCAGIGAAHPGLRQQALDQLLVLLERASHSLKTPALDLIVDNIPLVEDRLNHLASAGSGDAAELLAYAAPDQVSTEQAESAAQSLLDPLTSRSGVYSEGTGAVQQSVVARQLPAERRAVLVREQLHRARSLYESARNRAQYLLAAANLTDGLPDEDVEELLPLALQEGEEPAPSEADAMTGLYSHPLGAVRLGGSGDSRPAGVLLAAKLARSAEARRQVRQAALRLIGSDGDADYHVTQALQTLGEDLEPDVAWLAHQGWALRSLAAIVWAQSDSLPSAIGESLAGDADPRVRRALAGALPTAEGEDRTAAVRELLGRDPRFSVRRLVAPR